MKQALLDYLVDNATLFVAHFPFLYEEAKDKKDFTVLALMQSKFETAVAKMHHPILLAELQAARQLINSALEATTKPLQ